MEILIMLKQKHFHRTLNLNKARSIYSNLIQLDFPPLRVNYFTIKSGEQPFAEKKGNIYI